MSSFDWESFLRQWSQEILESMNQDQLAELPPDVIDAGWLGYPGATAKQISQTESRLGAKLPPSYREFLKVSNGWRQTPFLMRLWSADDIQRFAARHQNWIKAFTHRHENTQVGLEYAIALDEWWDPPSVTDEEYFVYGEKQDCSKLRVEYLQTAIEISDVGLDAIYLLNPRIVTDEGEWEAWFFADWLPGADRYRSFQDMMLAEYHNFLEQRDADTASDERSSDAPSAIDSSSELEPAVTEALTQELFSSEAETVADREPEIWRSLKRLTVEFQTRQIGNQFEYRTVTTAEGSPATYQPGLGKPALRQWLQEQLTDGMSDPHNPGHAAVDLPSAQPEVTLPATANLSKPVLDLALEIDQLAIRQDSRLSAPIIIQPAGLKQLKKTGYAYLTSQKPFSLEVVFKVVGQGVAELSNQPVTYQTQFHVQNRTTGQWIALGETQPVSLVHNQRNYTTYLFGNTLELGMYRLQVLTTLRGAVVALNSFELPLLNVV